MSTAIPYAYMPMASQPEEYTLSTPSASPTLHQHAAHLQIAQPPIYYSAASPLMPYRSNIAYLPTPQRTPDMGFTQVACFPQQQVAANNAQWQMAPQPYHQNTSQQFQQHPHQQYQPPCDLGASVFYPSLSTQPTAVVPSQTVIIPSQTMPVGYGYAYSQPTHAPEVHASTSPVTPAHLTPATTGHLCAAPGDVFGSAASSRHPFLNNGHSLFTPATATASSQMDPTGLTQSHNGAATTTDSPAGADAIDRVASSSQSGMRRPKLVSSVSHGLLSPPPSAHTSASGGDSMRRKKMKRSQSDAAINRKTFKRLDDQAPLGDVVDEQDDGDEDDDNDDEVDNDQGEDDQCEAVSDIDNGVVKTDVTAERPKKKRTRTAQACERCRIRKARCFGGQPCNRCTKRGFECEFSPTRAAIERSEQAQAAENDFFNDSPELADTDQIQPLVKVPLFKSAFKGASGFDINKSSSAARVPGSKGVKSAVSVLSQVRGGPRGSTSAQVSPVQSRRKRPNGSGGVGHHHQHQRARSSAPVPQSTIPLLSVTEPAGPPTVIANEPAPSATPPVSSGTVLGLGLDLSPGFASNGATVTTIHPSALKTSTPMPPFYGSDFELEEDLPNPGLVSSSSSGSRPYSNSISPFSGSGFGDPTTTTPFAATTIHRTMTGPLSSSSLTSSSWSASFNDPHALITTPGTPSHGQLGYAFPLDAVYQDTLDQLHADDLRYAYSPQLPFSGVTHQ